MEPETLDFGIGIIDFENPGELTVENLGSARLEIAGFAIEPESEAAIFAVASSPDELAPGESDSIVVHFIPDTPKKEYVANLVISSNDPNQPELKVRLTGIGGVREIEVFPEEIDFGVVDEGTIARRTLEIRNIGGDHLQLSEVSFTSTSVDLRLAGAPLSGLPWTVRAMTSTAVELVYSPVDLGADQGVVVIRSNDEDEPLVEVPVRGLANLAPRAIAWGCETMPGQIGCDGVAKRRRFSAGLRDRIALDGRESFDPEGEGITSFTWQRVLIPPMSNAVVFHSTEDRTVRMNATGDIEVDRVGTYDLRLVVKDGRGLESLDRAESHVLIAPKDLEIRMTWVDFGQPTDVDLHLVRPGGAVGDYGNRQARTSTGADCSTFNRAPNWNDLGTNLDDPALDIDAVSGGGPEIISLDTPEAQDVYRVFVHYCDSRNVGLPVDVRVEIYVRGELIDTVPGVGQTYTLSSGELWESAIVQWDTVNDTALVTPQTGTPPTLRPDLCMIQ